MWFQVVLLAAFFMATFMLWQRKENKGKKLADGRPDPVFGTLKTLQVALSFIVSSLFIPNYELLANWTKTCGGLMIVKFPTQSRPTVNIADLTIARRLMNSASWANRLPDDHYLHSITFNKPQGLVFSSGNWWKESRKVTMKLLHQLDFFRLENMERFIMFEISQVKSNLDQELKKSNGEITFSMHHVLSLPNLNVVYQVIMGTRFEQGDPFVTELFQRMDEYGRDFNIGTSVLEFLPWLRHVPGLTYMDSYHKISQFVFKYFKHVIEDRRKLGVYRTDPQDFVDYFLLELDQRAGQDPCYLTDESFLVTMRDIVLGGADTTNSALEYGILHLSLQPEIQGRVQAEIDQVIGQGRLPSYEDKDKMPYTQAVLMEILRYSTPIPLVSRSPLEDNEINGNFIPKGTICGINIYGIHRSTELWDDPEVFRPERFLNDQREIVNADKIIPFGHGKRVCVAETVARITLCIFLVSLLQKYSFEISPKHPAPSLKNDFGLSRNPMPYYVNVRSRSQSC